MPRRNSKIFVPARPRVAAFDLDDTLFKQLDFTRSAFREIAEDLVGKGVPAEKLFAEMIALRSRYRNVFDAVAPRFGLPVADLVERYRAHVPTLSLSAGTRRVLETLRSRGVVLGMITDGFSRTQRNKIRVLGLDEFFAEENIVISEEIGSGKPALRNFELLAEKFPGAEFCYVGDNPERDFSTPNALGWETICLLDDGGNVRAQDFSAVPADALPSRKIFSLEELL